VSRIGKTRSAERSKELKLLSEEELAAIQARADAATKGPWTAYHRCSGCTGEDDECCGIGPEITGPPNRVNKGQFERGADASFIAHAREDVPALLAEVRYLRRRLKPAEDALTHYGPPHNTSVCTCVLCRKYAAWLKIVEEQAP